MDIAVLYMSRTLSNNNNCQISPANMRVSFLPICTVSVGAMDVIN